MSFARHYYYGAVSDDLDEELVPVCSVYRSLASIKRV